MGYISHHIGLIYPHVSSKLIKPRMLSQSEELGKPSKEFTHHRDKRRV